MGIEKECCVIARFTRAANVPIWCEMLIIKQKMHVRMQEYMQNLCIILPFDMSLNCFQNVCKRASILKTKMQYTYLHTHIYTCPIKNASLFDGRQKCSRTLTAYLLWHHDISIGKKKSGGGINRVPVKKARKPLRDSHLIPDNGGKTSPGIQPESSQI